MDNITYYNVARLFIVFEIHEIFWQRGDIRIFTGFCPVGVVGRKKNITDEIQVL